MWEYDSYPWQPACKMIAGMGRIMQIVYALVALLIVLVVAWLSKAYLPMPDPFRTVLNIVLGLMVVGIVLWLIDTYVPMAGAIKGLLNVVVFAAACVGV